MHLRSVDEENGLAELVLKQIEGMPIDEFYKLASSYIDEFRDNIDWETPFVDLPLKEAISIVDEMHDGQVRTQYSKDDGEMRSLYSMLMPDEPHEYVVSKSGTVQFSVVYMPKETRP